MIRCDDLRRSVAECSDETNRRSAILRERLREAGALALDPPDIIKPQSLGWAGRKERHGRGASLKVIRVASPLGASYGFEVMLYLNGKRSRGPAIVYRASMSGFRDALLFTQNYLRTGSELRPEANEQPVDLTAEPSPV